MEPESTFNFGRATEISRDEIKFAKFITRLRNRFSTLFLKTLERQLILKNILTSEDWKKINQNIKFDFARDNYFDELKNAEIMRDRLSTLQQVDPYVGKYYSHLWIRKNVLHQDEDEIKEIDKEITDEMNNPLYNPPEAQAAAPATEEIESVLSNYNIINNLEKRYA
jgi:hypothetical protein